MENLTAEERFAQLGLTLPPAPKPLGVYKPCLIDGKYLYISGHGPVQDDKSLIIGRIGETIQIEEGKLAARQVGLTILSTIKTNLGSLNKVKRVIKVLGMVNCSPILKNIRSSSTAAANFLHRFGAKKTASACAVPLVLDRYRIIFR